MTTNVSCKITLTRSSSSVDHGCGELHGSTHAHVPAFCLNFITIQCCDRVGSSHKHSSPAFFTSVEDFATCRTHTHLEPSDYKQMLVQTYFFFEQPPLPQAVQYQIEKPEKNLTSQII